MNLSDTARAALARATAKRGPRKGKLLAKAPSPAKDFEAWAAWQGFHTAMGRHGEGATFALIMYPQARAIWEEVCDAVTAEAKRVVG